MTTLISDDQIILTAIQNTGAQRPGESDDDYRLRVRDEAIKARLMLDEKSTIRSSLAQVFGDKDHEVKRFPARVLSVGIEDKPRPGKEKASMRGKIALLTTPSTSKYAHAQGHEIVRTEPIYKPEGRMLIERLKAVVGHRVFLYVQIEEFEGSGGGEGGKSRVLRHFEDQGYGFASDEERKTALQAWVADPPKHYQP